MIRSSGDSDVAMRTASAAVPTSATPAVGAFSRRGKTLQKREKVVNSVAISQPQTNRLVRWSFVAAGTAFVGLGAVGVFLPGIPTVGPLLLAAWLFSKSCPHLEERLIRTPFFAPFHGYLDGTQAMPRKARLVAIAGMWCSILISSLGISYSGTGDWVVWLLIALGVVGTFFIWRFRSHLGEG